MSRFPTWFLWALVLCLMAATAGCTKSKEPAEVETLAFRVKEGDRVAYHVTVKAAIKAEDDKGQPIPMPQQPGGQNVEYDMALQVEKVEGDQATVRYELSSFPGGVGDMSFTVRVNTRTGQVVEVVDFPDMGLGPEMQQMLEEQMDQAAKQSLTQLPPDGKAEVGHSWTVEQAIPIPLPGLQNQSKLSVTTTYEADETKDGAEVAKMVVKGSGPMDLTMEANGAQLSMKGDVAVNGVSYVDRRTGLPHSGTSSAVLTITVTVKAPNGETQSFKMTSETEVSLTRK